MSTRPRARAATGRVRAGVSFADMAARRAERLVNLVICLLSTRQFLSAERIRQAVPGYEPADGSERADDAFKRMFERDKAELRDLGIPLETGRNSAFDSDDGYRITRREYELPPVEFDAAEAAAVGIAARLWQSATLAPQARSALIKLRAGGTDVDASGAPGAMPHIDASEPALPVLLDAARHARPVSFSYFKSGAGTPVSVFGAPDSFERPQHVDLLDHVTGRDPDETRVAHVRVTGSGAGRLRRLAESTDSEVLTVHYHDIGVLAGIVASAGPSALALDPPELVAAVVTRLSAAAGLPAIAGGAGR